MKLIPEWASSSFLKRFQRLINDLPDTIAEGTDHDVLAIFSRRPSDFDDMSVPSGELWEEVINKILKSVFGWGMEGKMDDITRRGRKGLDGLADFLKYFIVKRGVDDTTGI